MNGKVPIDENANKQSVGKCLVLKQFRVKLCRFRKNIVLKEAEINEKNVLCAFSLISPAVEYGLCDFRRLKPDT